MTIQFLDRGAMGHIFFTTHASGSGLGLGTKGALSATKSCSNDYFNLSINSEVFIFLSGKSFKKKTEKKLIAAIDTKKKNTF